MVLQQPPIVGGGATSSASLAITMHTTSGYVPAHLSCHVHDSTFTAPLGYRQNAFFWDFGDSGVYNVAEGQAVGHIYNTTGVKTVTLIAVDENGIATYTQSNYTVYPDISGAAIYVSATGLDSNNGTSPASAVRSIATGWGKLSTAWTAGATNYLSIQATGYYPCEHISSPITPTSKQGRLKIAPYGVGSKPILHATGTQSGGNFIYSDTGPGISVKDIIFSGTFNIGVSQTGTSLQTGNFVNGIFILFDNQWAQANRPANYNANLVVLNCEFYRLAEAVVDGDYSTVYHAGTREPWSGHGNIAVQGCTGSDFLNAALYLGGRHNTYIANDFRRVWDTHTCRLWYSRYAYIYDNTFYDPSYTITSAARHSLKMHSTWPDGVIDSKYNTISNNRVRGAVYPIHIGPNNDTFNDNFSNCWIDRNSCYPVVTGTTVSTLVELYGHSHTISNNFVLGISGGSQGGIFGVAIRDHVGNGADAALLEKPHSIWIVNNSFYCTRSSVSANTNCIALIEATGNNFSGFVIKGNSFKMLGDSTSQTSALIIEGSGPGLAAIRECNNNCVSTSGGHANWFNIDSVSYSLSQAQALGYDSSSITGDPQYISPTAYNLGISGGSPLINGMLDIAYNVYHDYYNYIRFGPHTIGAAQLSGQSKVNLTGTPQAYDVRMDWNDAVSGELGYTVLRSSTDGGPYSPIAYKTPNTTVHVDRPTLTPPFGNPYYYVVAPYSPYGYGIMSDQQTLSTILDFGEEIPPPGIGMSYILHLYDQADTEKTKDIIF